MTRKDFLLLSSSIAAAVKAIETEARALVDARKEEYGSAYRPDQTAAIHASRDRQLRGVRRTAAHIVDAIYVEQGNRFDVVRFLKDCGFGACHG